MAITIEQTWHETLEALRLRNGAVEITPIVRDEMTVAPTFRVRILEFNDTGITIERPQKIEASGCLVRGADVRVLAIDGLNRWELETTITGPTSFRLNAQAVVAALRLSPPRTARSGQRRTFFRVSTAGAKLEAVMLQPIIPLPENGSLPDPDAPAPEVIPPISARLLNIGGGGIGVEAPQRSAAVLPQFVRYRCGLSLPALSGPLLLIGRVVHLEPQADGTTYVGLCFEFDDRVHKRHCADEICRFTAWFQRQQLQRKAGVR